MKLASCMCCYCNLYCYSNSAVKVLITTGRDKYYSNGLDLEKLSLMSGDQLLEFVEKNQLLHQRLLTFSRPTIAAINGI